jgi:hypothetical protein
MMIVEAMSDSQFILLTESLISATQQRITKWFIDETGTSFIFNLLGNDIIVCISEVDTDNAPLPIIITSVMLKTNDDTAIRNVSYKTDNESSLEYEIKLTKFMYIVYKSTAHLVHIKDVLLGDRIERNIRQELGIPDVIEVYKMDL